MGRRDRRRAGPALRIPDRLLDALDAPPRDLAGAVARLNAGLIRERAAAGRPYLEDPALRAAYANYYLCANAPKLWPILDRLEPRLPARIRALELGGGPGTGVAALAIWCAENGRELDLTTTDLLPENVRAARQLGARLGVPVRGQVLRVGDALPGRYDLVLLMNVVNELPESVDAALVEQLHGGCAGWVVVVEPAAQGPSRRALALRDALTGAGWHVPLPCPHDRACPARAAGDWCHDEWPFERPPMMVAVDKVVGTRREVLKATWFVATRAAPDRAGWVRVVGARKDEKGRVRLPICGPDGLATLELQRRDRRPANADAWTASRFDRLRVTGATPVGDALRLGPDATCEREADTVDPCAP